MPWPGYVSNSARSPDWQILTAVAYVIESAGSEPFYEFVAFHLAGEVHAVVSAQNFVEEPQMGGNRFRNRLMGASGKNDFPALFRFLPHPGEYFRAKGQLFHVQLRAGRNFSFQRRLAPK